MNKEIVTLMAYLIGVDDEHLTYFEQEIIDVLRGNNNANVIRKLCMVRNKIIQNLSHLREKVNGLQNLCDTEIIHPFYIELKTRYKIDIRLYNAKVEDSLKYINQLLIDNISSCRNLFPDYVEWDYIKKLFNMENLDDLKIYFANIACYPYAIYINWRPFLNGNILQNDEKFLEIIYRQNAKRFDVSLVKDMSEEGKSDIYKFIDVASSIVFVVDCENCSPFSFYSMLKSLNPQELKKVKKIIFYVDKNSTVAWNYIPQYTNIEVETILSERLIENKSLVDIRITADVAKLHYVEKIDSLILFSSDSDFWGLISSIPTAKFFVMLENEKTSSVTTKNMDEHSIPYAMLDEFATKDVSSLKKKIVNAEVHTAIVEKLNALNIKNLSNEIIRKTWLTDTADIEMINECIDNVKIRLHSDGRVEFI